MTRVSVALCTFNGERYLERQWSTLMNQNRRPDEVVVRDDASTDGTWALLQKLAGSAPVPVRLTRNTTNVGFVQNFELAIRDCQADVIALSDQDDEWLPDKLEVAISYFDRSPDLALFFSDADLVDTGGRLLGRRAWETVGLSSEEAAGFIEGKGLRRLWNGHVVTGATVVMAVGLRDVALPIPRDDLLGPENWHAHDGWLAAVASTIGRVHAEPRPLIRYRIHPAQAIGLDVPKANAVYRVSTKDEVLYGELTRISPLVTRSAPCDGPAAEELRALDRHLRSRILARAHHMGAPRAVLGQLVNGAYDRHSDGWRSALRDLARR